MGWLVMCKGVITLPSLAPHSMFNKINDLLKAEANKKEHNFYDIQNFTNEICFEMSGNKGINYTPLEEIQKAILKMFEEYHHLSKEGLVISTTEYTENGEGYFFEKEEEN